MFAHVGRGGDVLADVRNDFRVVPEDSAEVHQLVVQRRPELCVEGLGFLGFVRQEARNFSMSRGLSNA